MDTEISKLKVYISGSLAGSSDLDSARDRYERLAESCIEVGCSAYLPHKNTDPVWAENLDSRTVYDTDLRELQGADVVVAYLGEPSLGVGAELAIAMQSHKHIVAIWEHERRMSRFVAGLLDQYGRAQVRAFSAEPEAHQFIKDSLIGLASKH